MSMRVASSSNIQDKENDVNKNCIGNICNGRAARTMVCGLLMALAVAGIASAQETTELKFRGGIGVVPVTGVAANGTVTLNVVRGVNPAGPWRIADLDAVVSSYGRIRVKGRGLLLAAGNGIGTNAGASVFATLFCGAGTRQHPAVQIEWPSTRTGTSESTTSCRPRPRLPAIHRHYLSGTEGDLEFGSPTGIPDLK
jgi:hypothetical protein